ncbi:MAG: hypothetical protein HC902_01150 [Calothrix sp. SM1_5_4]|nr:hypothetical protein [Calothrix sp. SM1_5_4]
MKHARGSALIEASGAVAVIAIFLAGVLLGGYLLFAKVWLEYQGEQALYCLAERRSGTLCRMLLRRKFERFLPWGRVAALSLRTERNWHLDLEWRLGGYVLRVRRELSPKIIVKSGVSR